MKKILLLVISCMVTGISCTERELYDEVPESSLDFNMNFEYNFTGEEPEVIEHEFFIG